MLPGLRIAAAASLGAGAVHAAAAGVHAEHVGLARIFIVLAALQLAAGGLALLRPSRLAGWLIIAVNGAAVAGWAITRVTGISWIDGLQTREAPQFADAACAALGVLAVAGAVAATLIGWQRTDLADDSAPDASPAPRTVMISAIPIIAIAALAVPAMLLGGTDVHTASATSAGATPHRCRAPMPTATHDHGAASRPDHHVRREPAAHPRRQRQLGGHPRRRRHDDDDRREPAARPRRQRQLRGRHRHHRRR